MPLLCFWSISLGLSLLLLLEITEGGTDGGVVPCGGQGWVPKAVLEDQAHVLS